MTHRLPERRTYKLNSLVHGSGPTTANNHHKNKTPESILSLVGLQRDDVETVSYPLPVDGVNPLYMSASEGRQIQRRPNRFAITWAQIIDKFRVGSILKLFQIRYALTFHSVSCRKVMSLVHRAAPSSLRSLFSWRSRTCFAGSETKSSRTRQITVIHTINRKNLQR